MMRIGTLAMAPGALLALLIATMPVAASEGRSFPECVRHHATTKGGFTGDHNPGQHQGASGWSGCIEA